MKKALILSLTALLLTGCANTGKVEVALENPAVVETNKKQEKPEQQETAALYPLAIEVFDQENKTYTQTFEKAPERVITNNQSSLELLLELGLEERIIGSVSLDNPLPEHLKAKGENIPIITQSKTEPAKEVVIGMNPDLVMGRVMTFTDEKFGAIDTLNEMGINAYVQLASQLNSEQSIDNIIADVRRVGEVFDVTDEANTLADTLQSRLDAIEEGLANTQEEPLKVLVMTTYVDGNYGVFGTNASLQNDILKRLNAVNIGGKGGKQSLENLLTLNPDVILYVTNSRNSETDAHVVEELLGNELIQTVPAIQNNKVIETTYTEFMGYGHRVFDCIENLAQVFYPEVFGK